ncbi:hypothetical protein BS78_03G182400 [Paspalum vaginatum]|nr:hypothetical protein BS78_03G182400 [Paspalum vaginatum]
MRPHMEEVSTIMLWLARMSNHFECVVPCGGHAQDFDMAQLFGPCSPVRHSRSRSMLTSLTAACLPIRSLVEQTVDTPIVEQAIVAPTDSPVEEVVLVEDASDDEDVVSVVTIENPIFLTTIEDVVTLSTVEVEPEVPQLLQDPPLHVVPPPAAKVRMGEDLACPSIQPPSPPTTTARRQRKSYNSSLYCRSARLAQCNALKDLGIIGSDGKLNDDIIQVYSDRLKDLVPSDLLKPLLSLKGRAFWDFLAEVSLPFR